MYKLISYMGEEPKAVRKLISLEYWIDIPFVPANTDYANFKKEILADEAQLQDADGNVMDDAKSYVASLP